MNNGRGPVKSEIIGDVIGSGVGSTTEYSTKKIINDVTEGE